METIFSRVKSVQGLIRIKIIQSRKISLFVGYVLAQVDLAEYELK